jgi:hypothetical protein
MAITSICAMLGARQGLAFGETFRIDTSGTEYCGDFDYARFSGRDALPLWVRLDNANQLTVSLTPSFDPGWTFPMFGYFYATRTNAASFVAGVVFDDGAYATIQGEARIDRNSGLVTQLRGVFIQNSVIDAGCFSSGQFRSARN